jgi:hypothetical protein
MLVGPAPGWPEVAPIAREGAPPAVTPPSPETVASAGRAGGPDEPAGDASSPAAARSWQRLVDARRGAPADAIDGVVQADPTTAVLIEDLSPRELEEFARLLRAQMGGGE